jgi:TRAP-type C4-dicarboxylate transport system substrate-binding protein
VISERTFQSLTPEQQTVLTETGAQFHGLARRNAARAEQEAITALRNRGLTVVPMSPADVTAWRTVGRQVRERVASQIAEPALIARAAAFGEQ